MNSDVLPLPFAPMTHALTGMRLECDVLDEQISPAANADLLEV
jgi:hypothetical protein